jgi:hypothetical protein
VQIWSYSTALYSRAKDDFLLVDSAGQCWRLTDVKLLEHLSVLRRVLVFFARIWRSPSVKVRLILEPTSCTFEDVKRQILDQIELDDDVLTQFTSPDALKQHVHRAQTAVGLIDALKHTKAVEFYSLSGRGPAGRAEPNL